MFENSYIVVICSAQRCSLIGLRNKLIQLFEEVNTVSVYGRIVCWEKNVQ